jgi:hypothetical protein
MTLPIVAFVLAARGELMVGNENGSSIRLFMVNSDDAEGIGIQRVRKTSAESRCFEGSVRYLLWEGQSEGLSANYCSCYDESTGYLTAVEGCEVK